MYKDHNNNNNNNNNKLELVHRYKSVTNCGKWLLKFAVHAAVRPLSSTCAAKSQHAPNLK